VDRHHVVAENAADQGRSQQADPELEQIMLVGAKRSTDVSGSDTLANARPALWSAISRRRHAPGARLGITIWCHATKSAPRRCAIGLSRLISRGLIVGSASVAFGWPTLAARTCWIYADAQVVEIEALQLAMRRATMPEAGILSALASDAPAHRAHRQRFSRGGAGFRPPAAQGFHTALLRHAARNGCSPAHSDLTSGLIANRRG